MRVATTRTAISLAISAAARYGISASATSSDEFGISKMYASSSEVSDDWVSDWTEPRTLLNAFDVDPHDSRCTLRGNGDIKIEGGVATFTGSPRLYIGGTSGGQPADAWDDVEVTAYGYYESIGDEHSSHGITLVARSKHSTYGDDGCDAAGYYAKIYRQTGQVSFQKEYYHPKKGKTIYTNTKRVNWFDSGLPPNQWIGLKFVVYTLPCQKDSVKLELYLDTTDGADGGIWTLAHELVDTPGSWEKNGNAEDIPNWCTVQDGDPITRPGTDCFIRMDGNDQTTVQWKRASIRNIVGGQLL